MSSEPSKNSICGDDVSNYISNKVLLWYSMPERSCCVGLFIITNKIITGKLLKISIYNFLNV